MRPSIRSDYRSRYAKAVIADTGCVGYWALDERAGTFAKDQKRTNNGTWTGSYQLGRADGPFPDGPQTANFVTTSYVTVPDNNSLDLGDGPFTIEIWARRSGTASGYVLNKGTNAYGIYFATSDNKFHFEKVNVQATATETGTTDTKWHYWVVSQPAGAVNCVIYKDGADVTSITNTSSFADTASALEIGRESGSTGFDGGLAHCALYNRALSLADVRHHYALAKGL